MMCKRQGKSSLKLDPSCFNSELFFRAYSHVRTYSKVRRYCIRLSNYTTPNNLWNKWERWEPEDKSRKNPVRTYWRRNEEQKDDIEEEEQNEWWEQEQNVGYNEDDERPDFYWDEDLKNGTGDDDNTDKVNDGEESLDK